MFNRLQEQGQTGFIPFSVAGYPNREESLEIFLALAEEGGDILEFGFPFSDPVADGPVIQKASAEAIRGGITMDAALDMVADIRKQSEIPIIFFGYFNPILKYGPERFISRRESLRSGWCPGGGPPQRRGALAETSWLTKRALHGSILQHRPRRPPE